MAVYPRSSRRRRSSASIAQISSSAWRSLRKLSINWATCKWAFVGYVIPSRTPAGLAMDRYRFGPCPGPSTQWQFGRPQRLYVSTNVPRRSCSIGGKSRTSRLRRLRKAKDERSCISIGPDRESVRANQKTSYRSTSNWPCAMDAMSSTRVVRPKASMSNGTAPAEICSPGGAQLVHSRGIANEPRSGGAGSMSRRPRHVGPSERRTAGRARDETDGRLQPIPKVDWIAVQFAGGVPTIADRVAQTVVKVVLEPEVEPIFHPAS